MQNMYGGFMIYSLICFTLRLLSLATVLAYAIFCCKTGVKMSTAAWKSCATTQVRVAKPGRDTAPLGGWSDNSFGDGRLCWWLWGQMRCVWGDVMIAWDSGDTAPQWGGAVMALNVRMGAVGKVMVALGTTGTEREGAIMALGAAGILWGHVRAAVGTQGTGWEGVMVTLGTVWGI